MNKPVTVAVEDLKTNLAILINESGIPPFIIEYILRDLYTEVKGIAKKQYENDRNNYERILAEIDDE